MLQRLIILGLFFNIFSCSNQSNSDNNQSHTIAFLDAFEDATVAQAKKGFFTALKDSGYVEGKNLNVIYRNAQGDIPALTQSVDFFISKQVDLIATNTTIDRSGLQTDESTLTNIGAGGLSGKPLRQRATDVIQYLNTKSKGQFPIIAVGGIHSAADALEKLNAGASLIQLYTGFIYEGPALIKKINQAILKKTA